MKAVQVLRVHQQRLACGENFAPRRALERYRHFLADQTFAFGKIQGGEAHLTARRIVDGQGRVVMADDAAQADRDGLQKFAQVEVGHQGVVDFEEQTQAVAFPRKLFLIALGVLKIERIVDGHGNLRRHLA